MFETLSLLGEFPENWNNANITSLSKGGRKEDLRNYRPVSSTLVTRRAIRQTILENISEHTRDRRWLGVVSTDFWEGKSSLTNRVVFDSGCCRGYCLAFSKTFDTLSHNILTDKLIKYRLDKRTENWWNCWAQSVMNSSMKSRWRPVPVVIPRDQYRSQTLFNIFIKEKDDPVLSFR